MKWPWFAKSKESPGLKEAKQGLAKARSDEPRVAEVVEALEQKQRENRFGPKVHMAMSQPRRKH